MLSAISRKHLLYFALPVLWMGCLFYFSTDVLSSQHTGNYLEPFIRRVLHKVRPQSSEHAVWMIHVFIRKLGHVTEYALLAFLWALAFKKSESIVLRRVMIVAACLSIGYAALDEWHQTFTPSRSGRLQDVLIDVVGVLIGLVVFSIIDFRFSIKKRPS